MRLERWPAADGLAWQAAFRPGGLLESAGAAARWSAATKYKNMKGYGRWLTWLERQGILDRTVGPAAHATPARVAAYVSELRQINGMNTILSRLHELDDCLRVMAPDGSWDWIRRIQSKIRAYAIPVRDKRTRVRHSADLFKLGLRLMRQAEGSVDLTPLQRAWRYRDGLMIALLAARPIRRCNFAAMAIDRNLVRRGDEYWLELAEEETKTRRRLDAPIPLALAPYLERYLAHYRLVLLTRGDRILPRPTEALWISQRGGPMKEIAFYFRIRIVTKEAFGVVISPHLFRDCAATSIAIDDPVHVRVAAAVLGHTTLATTERHYNQARSLDASRLHQRTIAALRRSIPGRRRGQVDSQGESVDRAPA